MTPEDKTLKDCREVFDNWFIANAKAPIDPWHKEFAWAVWRAAIQSRAPIPAQPVGEVLDAVENMDEFIYDPATGFVHADDGGAPKHGIKWVREETTTRQPLTADRQKALEWVRVKKEQFSHLILYPETNKVLDTIEAALTTSAPQPCDCDALVKTIEDLMRVIQLSKPRQIYAWVRAKQALQAHRERGGSDGIYVR